MSLSAAATMLARWLLIRCSMPSQGFQFDLVQGKIGFNPIGIAGVKSDRPASYSALSGHSILGGANLLLHPSSAELRLLIGSLTLRSLSCSAGGSTVSFGFVGDQPVAYEQTGAVLRFPSGAVLEPGKNLHIHFDNINS